MAPYRTEIKVRFGDEDRAGVVYFPRLTVSRRKGRALAVWFAVVCGGLVSGCGDECVFDTDCPLFTRCAQGQCLRLGVRIGEDAGRPDASQPDAGNPDSGGPVEGGMPITVGTLVAAQATLGGGTWSFSGSFGGDPACDETPIPPCQVTACTVPGGASGRPAMAGTLSLLDGLLAPMITPEADGTYVTQTGAGVLWDASLGLPALPELRIQAMGAPASRDLGPFTLNLEGPYVVDVTAPDFSMPVTLLRAAPTDFQWATDVGATALVVSLQASEDLSPTERREVTAECTFSGTAGTVPAAAVAALPGVTASYRIVTRAATARMVEEWAITGQLETEATQQGGTAAAQGSVTLM